MSTTKAIVTVNSDNRVEGVRYGPYTSEDATGSNEYIIEVEFFPSDDPLGALFNPTDNSFTYSSEESE